MKHLIDKAKPFLVIFMTTLMLVAASLFNVEFTIMGFKLRDINIISDFKKVFYDVPDASLMYLIQKDTSEVPVIHLDSLSAMLFKIDMDSLLEQDKNDLRISAYHNESTLFTYFFPALKSVRDSSQKTRIAYFGDSMIEGDLISQSLRNDLQSKFGGKGVGFVPITSIVSKFRRSIRHEFSDDWTEYSILRSPKGKNFSPAGFVYNPRILTHAELMDTLTRHKVSFVSYYAPYDSYVSLSRFYNTKLFYGKASPGTYINYFIDGQKFKAYLTGQETVNSLVLNSSKAYNELFIEFFTDTILDVYGVSFESNQGVFVDNYAVRGNLGLALEKIPGYILSAFSNYMDYSLLVFQFGLNVAAPETRSFTWYENAMVKVVEHYKKYIPNTDVLIISIGDKSIKQDMQYVTQPTLPLLVEAQRNIARRTSGNFWNLFQNMGGYNAMVSWVEAKVPLAAKDYAHINFKGAEKISNMLTRNIINEFRLYEYNQMKGSEKDRLVASLKSASLNSFMNFENLHNSLFSHNESIIPPFLSYQDYFSATYSDLDVEENKIIIDTLTTIEVHENEVVLSDFGAVDSVAEHEISPQKSYEYRIQIAASNKKIDTVERNNIIALFRDKEIFEEIGQDRMYRYFIGSFYIYDDVVMALQKLNNNGHDGFIVGLVNGRKSSISKTRRMEAQEIDVQQIQQINDFVDTPMVFIDLPNRHKLRPLTFNEIHKKASGIKDTLDYVTVLHNDTVIEFVNLTEENGPVFRVQFMASRRLLGKEHYGYILDLFPESMVIISHDDDGYIRYMLGNFSTYSEAQEVLTKLISNHHDAFITALYKNKRISTDKALEIINNPNLNN
ncbi:MAG: hypothetical protein PHT69_06660 [Bacteroidales bacterium]|nr:hypothetical protein [Bacteroidales bacterium]